MHNTYKTENQQLLMLPDIQRGKMICTLTLTHRKGG